MEKFPKSSKLDHVCYDIRGPVHKKALQLEEEGNKILKLNIGNPAPFGFEAPDEILVDVIRNLQSHRPLLPNQRTARRYRQRRLHRQRRLRIDYHVHAGAAQRR